LPHEAISGVDLATIKGRMPSRWQEWMEPDATDIGISEMSLTDGSVITYTEPSHERSKRGKGGQEAHYRTSRSSRLPAKRFLSDEGEKICREAGIAKGTYYLYFDSKEEVILSIFSEVMDSAVSPLALDPALDPIEKVIGIVRGSIDRGLARLEMVPVILGGRGTQDRAIEIPIERQDQQVLRQPLYDRQRDLEGGAGQGSINPSLDTATFARMLTSAAAGIILHAALFYKDDAAFLRRQSESLMEMVRGYLQPEKDQKKS